MPLTGIWTHIAATYNADLGEAKVYINGEKVLSWNKAKKEEIFWKVPFDIGEISGGKDTSFQGALSRVEIFDRKLTKPELASQMQECSLDYEGEALSLLPLLRRRRFAGIKLKWLGKVPPK